MEDPTAIVTAIEENLYSFGTSQFSKWPRIEVYDEAHLLWFMCDVPSPAFNMVHRARWLKDETDAAIVALQERYAKRRLPILWWVGPSSTPVALSRYLTARGFVPAGETAGMAINLEKLNAPRSPDNLKVTPTHDARSLLDFAHTACLGFDMSSEITESLIELTLAMGYGTKGSLINYLGRLDGRPVVTASLYLGETAAGIYNVSTVPEARGQGFGTAVTVASLLEAARRGYRLAVLHSSVKAQTMYRRLGFDTYCYFHLYQWQSLLMNSPS